MIRNPRESIQQYAEKYGRTILDRFGVGAQGCVYGNDVGNAVKAFERESAYANERNAYLRIRKARIEKAGPFNIPQLIRFDDDLWIIEMTVVNPPFMLDFAGAYIDRRHPYDDETIEELHAEGEETYGKERWEIVQLALSTLKGKTGIQLVDVHLGNVRFENDYS